MDVAVVGLGYVGLPLTVAFARAGHQVTAFDIDQEKITSLIAHRSYIEDVHDSDLVDVGDKIKPTTDISSLAASDAVLICVPTPLTANREPDLQPLRRAIRDVASVVREDQLIVLESTTYPGTTRAELQPVFEEKGFTVGQDIYVAFSPERVDPGRTDYTLKTTPKVVGGITSRCLQRAKKLYEEVCDEVIPVSTPEAAELSKLLENTFRSVNIALVNELAILADRMNIDIWEVIDAAATKPYGFMRFEPGPGMGGHCLPVDPFYLTWRAREFSFSAEFIELAGKINQQMPYYCVERIQRALNQKNLSLRDSKVALLGVSYKANVGDLRESPSLKIMKLLRDQGAYLSYHDPHIQELHRFRIRSTPFDQLVREADLIVIVTAHENVNYELLFQQSSAYVLDLRGITRFMETNETAVEQL